ncbi:hypothetical protein LTR04_001202 [Oleoguttula sp. CCFEE 6159]|nr:hypothetical protein LTR04_001202 [Oleoguttula sp. CCFEE 6159]
MTDDDQQAALQVTAAQLEDLDGRVVDHLEVRVHFTDFVFENPKPEKKAEVAKDVIELLSDVFAEYEPFPVCVLQLDEALPSSSLGPSSFGLPPREEGNRA